MAQPILGSALISPQLRHLYNQYANDPDIQQIEKEPDEWEVLIDRAREQGLTQEDIELALALKASGLTRADVAIMEALKERLHG